MSVTWESLSTVNYRSASVSLNCPQSAFFHLSRLREFRWMFDLSSRQCLVSAFIISRIDFCNAMLAGLPACTLSPFQSVLSAVRRRSAGACSRRRHHAVATLASGRLSDLLQAVLWCTQCTMTPVHPASQTHNYQNSDASWLQSLRFAKTRKLDISRIRTKFRECFLVGRFMRMDSVERSASREQKHHHKMRFICVQKRHQNFFHNSIFWHMTAWLISSYIVCKMAVVVKLQGVSSSIQVRFTY